MVDLPQLTQNRLICASPCCRGLSEIKAAAADLDSVYHGFMSSLSSLALGSLTAMLLRRRPSGHGSYPTSEWPISQASHAHSRSFFHVLRQVA